MKWVGGKTQIIDKIISCFPREIYDYHEIFLGGGSVLFALLSYIKMGRIAVYGNIYAYDINQPLIYVYKNIQSNHIELYNILQEIIQEYKSCASSSIHINRKPNTIEDAIQCKENYYYWVRSEYNHLSDKTTVLASAFFIFLNKTCFRGIFRMGPNGFNVPYGNYENPEIINIDHLNEIHMLIRNVIFECCDFRESISQVKRGSFVYIDPPYAPEKSTSFVGYTEHGFSLEMHNTLFEKIDVLSEDNIQIMMNNADVDLVRNHFEE